MQKIVFEFEGGRLDRRRIEARNWSTASCQVDPLTEAVAEHLFHRPGTQFELPVDNDPVERQMYWVTERVLNKGCILVRARYVAKSPAQRD